LGSAEVTSSAPKPLAQEPPSTADAEAREVEEMVSSILRDSPTPDAEKGSEKLPEETPIGKLVVPESKFFIFTVLVFCNPSFSLDLQNQGNFVEKVEEAPCSEAGVVVGTSTSLASPGSAPLQEEKLKLAQENLASRISF